MQARRLSPLLHVAGAHLVWARATGHAQMWAQGKLMLRLPGTLPSQEAPACHGGQEPRAAGNLRQDAQQLRAAGPGLRQPYPLPPR